MHRRVHELCETHLNLLAKVLNEVATAERYLFCLALLVQVGYEIKNVDVRSLNSYHPCGVLSVKMLLANV